MAETKKASIADEFADLTGTPAGEFADLLEPSQSDLVALRRARRQAPSPPIQIPRGEGMRSAGLGFLTPVTTLLSGLAPGDPVYREGAPLVGPKEAALTGAVGMVPLGKPAVNAGSALSLHALKAAGRAAPGVARTLSGIPILGELAPPAGPGAKLTPQAAEALRGMGEDVPPEAEDPSLLDEYRAQRERSKERAKAGEEQNPLASRLGKAGGFALTALAPLPKFSGGSSLLSKSLAGAGTGAGYGALGGLTEGEADLTRGEYEKAALEGAFGATLGGLLGGTIPVVGEGFRRMARGFVRPDAEAKALQEAGVKGLTIGQMDPKSALGSAESALQSTMGFGPAIKAQREVAQNSFRVAAANKVRPPGMPEIPQNTPVTEAMTELHKGYAKAYDAIRDVPVPTTGVDRLLVAVNDPDILAGETERKTVEKFLLNQMSKLPAAGTATNAGLLINIRSKIREKFRDALKGNKTEIADLLERAEEEISNSLEASLPKEAAAALRATDGQYRNFKMLQRAVVNAGDPTSGQGNFAAGHLSNAVKAATPEGVYDQGGGGPLRSLSWLGKRAFEDVAPTGWGAQLAGNPLIRPVAAPAVYFANRPGGQRFMLGETGAQQSMRALDDFLSRYIQGPITYPASSSIIEAAANRRRNQETP